MNGYGKRTIKSWRKNFAIFAWSFTYTYILWQASGWFDVYEETIQKCCRVRQDMSWTFVQCQFVNLYIPGIINGCVLPYTWIFSEEGWSSRSVLWLSREIVLMWLWEEEEGRMKWGMLMDCVHLSAVCAERNLMAHSLRFLPYCRTQCEYMNMGLL